MTTTHKYYPWAKRWYVMSEKRLNAAGQPTAQCGPYRTMEAAMYMSMMRKAKTGDETLHILEQDINRMAIRPTRIDKNATSLT